jgi:opacity protein-like surface antigen
MKRTAIATLCVFLLLSSVVYGQNNRLNTHGSIGWYNAFVNVQTHKKYSLHGEFQWRRADLIAIAQQSLLRVGLNYHLNPRILFRAGYAWIETFPYGEIPLNVLGRDFTEHRFYQMVQLTHKEDIVEFSHRFMLEQRFIGRYSSAAVMKEDEFVFSNRLRYMFRAQLPLKGKSIADKTPYIALYDEIFIGFGENVNANVFDQNRLGVMLGYRFNKTIRIEGGYLNQILQFGRQINGQSVFQYNNGVIVNTYVNIDAMRKSK